MHVWLYQNLALAIARFAKLPSNNNNNNSQTISNAP